MRRKNSWIRQLGILYILGMPLMLDAGKKEALGGVIIAALLSFLFLPLLYKIRERRKNFGEVGMAERWALRGILFVGLILATTGITAVAWWYSEAVTWLWLCVGMIVLVLLIGRGRGEAGRDCMIGVWEKILGAGIFFVLIFQIPNFEGFETLNLAGSMKEIQWERMWGMGLALFGINLPFYLAPLYEEKGEKKEIVFSHCILWATFFLSSLLLVGMWEIPVLRNAPFPFILMGQSGQGFQGESIRLEAITFLISLVLLYFSAGACMDGLKGLAKENAPRRAGKEVVTVVAAGLVAGILCGGCSARLSEKQLVLIGDETQLESAEKTVELSSMKVLVIHSEDLLSVVSKVLKRPDVAMSIPVVYSKEPLHQQLAGIMEEKAAMDAMAYVEEFTKPGTKISRDEYVTIREVLNAWATGERLSLPIGMVTEDFSVKGKAVYQNGKLFSIE